MRRQLNAVARASTLWAVALIACACGSNPRDTGAGTGGGGAKAAPGTVMGTAVDTQGRPIANAKVVLEPSLTKGFVTTTTGSDGTYRFEGLPSVPYTTQAWTRVTFNGQPYCLRLGMPDATQYNDFNPKDGAVRNFQWQLTGPIPDFEGRYFGGHIYLDFQGDFTGATMELTYTPTSTRLDGSAADSFMQTVDTSMRELSDIPAANYTVTGTITRGSDVRPLHIGVLPADSYDAQTEAAALTFKPGGNPCISLDNGLDSAYLNINSPYTD